MRAAWPEPDVCLYDDEKGREKLAAELDQWPGGKIKPFDPEFMFMNSDGDVKMTREKLGLPPGLWRVGPNGENIIEWSASKSSMIFFFPSCPPPFFTFSSLTTRTE